MPHKKIFIHMVRVLIFAIITLTFLPKLLAQTNKPKQLRNEMLQAAPKETKITTPKKKKSNQPPPVGVTVFKPATLSNSKNTTLINIEHGDEYSYNQMIRPDIQVVKGNVKFRHENALLYCDSAYFNESLNSFDAFSNIRIVQGDTLTIYGDYMNYNGNSKIARIWDNVKMVNKNTVLTTDSLYYDRTQNLAFYFTGGVIKDGNNTLTSIWGQYSPATKIALFKDRVVMTNPNSKMTTDTLKYNTSTSVADIVGNSHVVYNKETDVYSKRGWYNTKSERMMLLNRSLVEQNDGKTLTGDTIFYDKKNKYGEAFSKVELNDPKQETTLYGNFVSYDERKKVGLATDSALLVDWSSKDSLFMSADTLYSYNDSTSNDSVSYKGFKAFKNVRFFRKDAQGMCDSLFYTSRDSILYLKALPVLWAGRNQMKGHEITVFTKNQKADKAIIKESAIAIQKDSLNYFNQLAGKKITAFLDSGEVKKIFVDGNAETIYFPKDDKTHDFIGINKTLSSYITAYFKNKKIERIVLTKASSGVMYPLKDMSEDDLYLVDFYWYDKERPEKVADLFKKFARTEPPKKPESTKRPAFPEESSGKNKESRGNKTSNRNNRNNMQNANGNSNNSFNSQNSFNRGRNMISR